MDGWTTSPSIKFLLSVCIYMKQIWILFGNKHIWYNYSNTEYAKIWALFNSKLNGTEAIIKTTPKVLNLGFHKRHIICSLSSCFLAFCPKNLTFSTIKLFTFHQILFKYLENRPLWTNYLNTQIICPNTEAKYRHLRAEIILRTIWPHQSSH